MAPDAQDSTYTENRVDGSDGVLATRRVEMVARENWAAVHTPKCTLVRARHGRYPILLATLLDGLYGLTVVARRGQGSREAEMPIHWKARRLGGDVPGRRAIAVSSLQSPTWRNARRRSSTNDPFARCANGPGANAQSASGRHASHMHARRPVVSM